jgi:peroxiredoxin
MPSLQALHADLGPRGLRVAGLSVDAGPGSAATLRDFLEEYTITYTILHDPDGRIQHAYQVFGIPTTYLVDRGGRVVQRWIGELDFGAPEIREEFERALDSGAQGSESGEGSR